MICKSGVAGRFLSVLMLLTFAVSAVVVLRASDSSAAGGISAEPPLMPVLSYVGVDGRLVSLQQISADIPGLARFSTDNPRRPLRLGNGLLVRFTGPTREVPGDLMALAGINPERPIDREMTTWLFRADGPESVLMASRILAGRPGVRWALPDFVVHFDLHSIPGRNDVPPNTYDPFYSQQWAFLPGETGTIDAQIAWNVTKGDPRVVVAVIDTGVDNLHPDLGADRFVPGWDALESDDNAWPGPLAAGGHGTHCAGIIGALHNDRGVAGLCPDCKLMGLRFLTGLPGDEHVAELSNAAEALHQAADKGAWVINNSWGIYNINKPKVPMEPILEAARYAATHGGPDGNGAFVVFASGNQTGWDEAAQKAYALKIAADDLAALPEVMSVGATGPDDVRQLYSQYGPELDITAPGGGFLPTDPQIVTLDTSGETAGKGNGANKGDGAHYASALLLEATQNGLSEPDLTGEVTVYFNGTSSAAPMVAGVAALIWSADLLDGQIDLSAADVRRIIEATADKVGPLPYAAGRNDEYGHGRLNAGRAVEVAVQGLDVIESDTVSAEDSSDSGLKQDVITGENVAADSGPVETGTVDAGLTDYGTVIVDNSIETGGGGCSASGNLAAGSGSHQSLVFLLLALLLFTGVLSCRLSTKRLR